MENEKQSNSIFVLSMVVALLIIVIAGILIKINRADDEKIAFEKNRVKCNQTVLGDKALQEKFEFTFCLSNETDALKKATCLESELARSNKEINRLRSLFGWYFDR